MLSIAQVINALQVPIPMLLFCPRCGEKHVDASDEAAGWTNPPHRSHLCHGCGCIWRPADFATEGVASIATKGDDDNWVGSEARPSSLINEVEGRRS